MGGHRVMAHWRYSYQKAVLPGPNSGGAVGTGAWDEVVRRIRCQKKMSEGTINLQLRLNLACS
jgi:hypothetical protein